MDKSNRIKFGVGLEKDSNAPTEEMNPFPVFRSKPGFSISVAVLVRRVRISNGGSIPYSACASKSNAATPAACGAAADVPKKLGRPSLS